MGRGGGGRGGGGGRSSGGFFSRSSSASSSSSKSTATATAGPTKAAPTAPAQPKAPPTAGTSGPGLLGTMAEGMAWGAGTEISRQAVRAVMGNNGSQVAGENHAAGTTTSEPQQPLCFGENNNFVECLKFNSNDIARCQYQFDSVQTCRQGFGF